MNSSIKERAKNVLRAGSIQELESFVRELADFQSSYTASPADVARDAERYRWLTEDHPKAETRLAVETIANSISVRSYANTSAAIDAAIERQGGER